MVIVAGWIDVEVSARDDYLASRREAMIATRDEPGCIDYVFSPDPIDPGRVRLFERWASRSDLDVHLQAMRARPAPAASIPVIGREVIVYEVASDESLG